MKLTRKLLVMLMALMMVFAFAACGSNDGGEEAGLANPVNECTHDELVQTTGVDIDAPEGAEDVVYSWIENGDIKTAQVDFTVDGDAYCYRAEFTDKTDLGTVEDPEADMDTLTDSAQEAIADGAAIAGLSYDWDTSGVWTIQDRPAVLAVSGNEAGFIYWLDVVPGVAYTLSMPDGCSGQDALTDMADQIFVPMQGEA